MSLTVSERANLEARTERGRVNSKFLDAQLTGTDERLLMYFDLADAGAVMLNFGVKNLAGGPGCKAKFKVSMNLEDWVEVTTRKNDGTNNANPVTLTADTEVYLITTLAAFPEKMTFRYAGLFATNDGAGTSTLEISGCAK
jgi:hypothetical protein